MPLADQHDTIAAIASARGPAERGVVRIAGPKALAVVERLGAPSFSLSAPKLLDSVELRIELAGQPRPLPCDLFVWPDERSYTKQPSVEIHTVGSSPLLEALLQACLAVGARLAEPGEFTLRAFLAGRLDLVQAEAVLAVIDAHHTGALETALSQLAGGLSGPLHTLRSELLGLLADLEAGLDFVEEEDVRFVEQEELARRLEEAREIIEQAIEQTTTRGDATHRPRVVIAGAPNVGKSSLFNALVERFGQDQSSSPALVANQPGVTRDAVKAHVSFGGVLCELLDTAGVNARGGTDEIDSIAQAHALRSRTESDLVLHCHRADEATQAGEFSSEHLLVATQCDRLPHAEPVGEFLTSAHTGQGLEELAQTIRERLSGDQAEGQSEAVAQTAERCTESLRQALGRLEAAQRLAAEDRGEELVSLELRGALDDLGRVVGEVVTDEVLGQIFGKFCIGK